MIYFVPPVPPIMLLSILPIPEDCICVLATDLGTYEQLVQTVTSKQIQEIG